MDLSFYLIIYIFASGSYDDFALIFPETDLRANV